MGTTYTSWYWTTGMTGMEFLQWVQVQDVVTGDPGSLDHLPRLVFGAFLLFWHRPGSFVFELPSVDGYELNPRPSRFPGTNGGQL